VSPTAYKCAIFICRGARSGRTWW